MLGTNDLKTRFSVTGADIANSAGVLVGMAQRSETGVDGDPPEVLLMAPPPITRLTSFDEMFQGAEEKSKSFPEQYRRVAEERGCYFLDTSEFIVSSPLDGIHFEGEDHGKLGRAVADKVREILG